MRAFTSVRLRTAAAAGLLLLGGANVSVAQSESDSSVYARTMQAFLTTVDKAKTIQFEMTISVRRPGEGPTVPEVRRYRVSVSRPDRLAVVPLTPETAQFGMASDGEELLCYAPRSRQYCVVDAREALPGIYDVVFKGAARDAQVSLALRPFIGDTTGWKGREPCDFLSGEALGQTEYAGAPCEVFLGPGLAAAYFEKDERALYRGRQTTGEGSRLSGSGQWVTGEIAAVTIDKWILDGAISSSEFSVKPPTGYQRVNDPTALPPEPNDNGRAAPAGLATDLPANASPAVVRRRAWTLFTTGYDSHPVTGQLFQRAADNGDPLAGMWVARLQQKAQAGFRADPAAAAKRARTVAAEVKRLAETGNPEAQFLWGMACVTGLGTPANPKEGLHWLLAAAEKGDVLAMDNAGSLLMDGVGGPRDEAKGFDWTEKAARQGDGLASGNLGLFYHWGMGVEPDRGKALEWYMKAISLGYEHADDMGMLAGGGTTHPFTADAIRAGPCVKLLGTRIEDLQKAAVAAGIVPADAVLLAPGPGNPWPAYGYKKNGIAFVPRLGQMREAELYAQGVKGFDQFSGQLPLGLVWDPTFPTLFD